MRPSYNSTRRVLAMDTSQESCVTDFEIAAHRDDSADGA